MLIEIILYFWAAFTVGFLIFLTHDDHEPLFTTISIVLWPVVLLIVIGAFILELIRTLWQRKS
jgi:hypothetical protein